MSGEFYLHSHHYIITGSLQLCNISISSGSLAQIPHRTCFLEWESEVAVWIEPGQPVATNRRALTFGNRMSGWDQFE
jgi:hypothetical protein